jgi:hypothetical protein
MMQFRQTWIVTVLLVALGGQPLIADVAPAPFPMPSATQPAEYMQAAVRFVESNPQSQHAPRVLLDMLMMMTAGNRAADADNLRRWLLLGYPGSLEARYLVTTFADAVAYRKLLTETAGPIRHRMVANLGSTLFPSFLVAHNHFKQDLVRDVDYVLRIALAAEAANQLVTRDELLAFVRQQPLDDTQRQLLKLMFEDTRPVADRCIDLHQLRGRPAADLAVEYLITTLSDQQHEQPGVQRLLFERDMLALRFSEALARQARLRGDAGFDPQYFLGWCVLGLQDAAGAHQRWEAVEHPQYRQAAARLASAAGQLQPTMAAQVELLGQLLRESADTAQHVEARLQLPVGEQIVDVLMTMDWAAGRIQVAVFDGQRVLAALDSDGAQTRLYVHDSDHVQRCDGGMAPILGLAFTPGDAGRFDFSFSFRMSNSVPEALVSARTILDSPFLRRQDQTWMLLNSVLTRLTLPLPITEDPQGKTARWLTATAGEPTLKTSTLTVSPDGRTVRFQRDRMNLSCKFGDAHGAAVELLWPADLPTREVSRQQMSMQLMSKVMTLMGRDGPGPHAAGR